MIPREGLASLFSLFACRLRGVGSAPEVPEESLVVRRADGAHTPAMHVVRARLGFQAK